MSITSRASAAQAAIENLDLSKIGYFCKKWPEGGETIYLHFPADLKKPLTALLSSQGVEFYGLHFSVLRLKKQPDQELLSKFTILASEEERASFIAANQVISERERK